MALIDVTAPQVKQDQTDKARQSSHLVWLNVGIVLKGNKDDHNEVGRNQWKKCNSANK